jgi:hypothetical protein
MTISFLTNLSTRTHPPLVRISHLLPARRSRPPVNSIRYAAPNMGRDVNLSFSVGLIKSGVADLKYAICTGVFL